MKFVTCVFDFEMNDESEKGGPWRYEILKAITHFPKIQMTNFEQRNNGRALSRKGDCQRKRRVDLESSLEIYADSKLKKRSKFTKLSKD
ncbi:hypothetical protein L484_022211 [Morus notabilis]|uniref:Uncharacterized protein n=1 Tax=Morus notabilis TaxID=981085 RepID=W9RNG9_9ROSA|nr:hypothetical protein L484_022211 [Morus notabilis]